jgi:hypothetical protein
MGRCSPPTFLGQLQQAYPLEPSCYEAEAKRRVQRRRWHPGAVLDLAVPGYNFIGKKLGVKLSMCG